jgi:hypothetical protein
MYVHMGHYNIYIRHAGKISEPKGMSAEFSTEQKIASNSGPGYKSVGYASESECGNGVN